MQESSQMHWNIYQKVIFRFTFILFSFYIIPFPFSFIPGLDQSERWYLEAWTPIYDWLGRLFFDIGETLQYTPSGSGDRTFDYMQNFSYLLVASVFTVIWSVIDRKRISYQKLYNFFIMIVSYYLGGILLIYGLSKIFYLQFREPSLTKLLETYGQSSPMRLMWTFMGSSELYTKFSGYCEVFAGLLLFYHRTRTLGGLVTIGVMLNVFMLNLSYDIPVKLYSLLLVMLGIYVIVKDYGRIINLFVLNKPTEPNVNFELQASGKWKKLIYTLQIAFVSFIIYHNIDQSIDYQSLYGNDFPTPPLYGIYDVVSMEKNGAILTPLLTDSSYWKYLVLDKRNSLIKKATDESKYLLFETDTIKNLLTFKPYNDTINAYQFSFQQVDKQLFLEGIYESDSLKIELEYHGKDEFLLLNRGFNWVNEYPNNRYDYRGFHP